MSQFLLEEWEAMEHDLLRERGLWGPPVGSELDKWQLDLTEGPYRMRKKMIDNNAFYTHYPYRPPDSELAVGRIYKLWIFVNSIYYRNVCPQISRQLW